MARKMALRPSHEHLLEGERSEMKSIYIILTCVQRECVTRFSNLLLVFNLPEGEWHGEERSEMKSIYNTYLCSKGVSHEIFKPLTCV